MGLASCQWICKMGSPEQEKLPEYSQAVSHPCPAGVLPEVILPEWHPANIQDEFSIKVSCEETKTYTIK